MIKSQVCGKEARPKHPLVSSLFTLSFASMFRRTAPSLLRAAKRGYATDAVVTPPLQLYGLPGTYASALYTASVKASSIANTEKTMEKLKNLVTSDPKVGVVLMDPSLGQGDKDAAIKIVTDSIGGDKVFTGFLDVLAANNRLALLNEIAADFQKLADAEKGLVEASVTSAKPLDKSSLSRIEKAVSGSKYVGKGKTLKLENIVQPDIKGGLVVTVGDRTVDLSVASKLQKYNQLLTEAA